MLLAIENLLEKFVDIIQHSVIYTHGNTSICLMTNKRIQIKLNKYLKIKNVFPHIVDCKNSGFI